MNLLKPYCERDQSVVSDAKAAAVMSTLVCVGEKNTVNPGIVQGRLPNSKILAHLDAHFSYLHSSKRSDITDLIQKYNALFVPTQTNALERDTDVGDAAPVKQRPQSLSVRFCARK